MDFTDLVHRKKIDLKHKNLRGNDLYVLVKVMRESKALEELNLAYTHITLADGKFADALAKNRTLLKLVLQNNRIGNDGAKRLADAMKSNNTLQVIELSGNQIRIEGATRLADALKRNHTLQYIALDRNQIGDEGAKSLAAAFVVNKALREVRLSWSGIGDVGAQSLAASLLVNGGLKRVHLAENNINDKGGKSLANALRCNRSINTLWLYNNNKISDGVMAEIEDILEDPKRKDRERKSGALDGLLRMQSFVEEKSDENARLKGEIVSTDEKLALKDKELASHQAEIQRKDARLAQARKEIRGRDRELESKDKKIASLKDIIDLSGGENDTSTKRPRVEESNLLPHQRSRTAEAFGMVTMNDNELTCWTCGEDYSFDMDATEDDARKRLPVISSCYHTCCHGCILHWQLARAERNHGRVAKRVPCMLCKTNSAICPSEPKYDRRLIDLLGRCSR